MSLRGRLTLLLLAALALTLVPLGVFTLFETRAAALATLEDMALARLGLYRELAPGSLLELFTLAQEVGGYGFLASAEGLVFTDTAARSLPPAVQASLAAGEAYRGLYDRYLFVTLPLTSEAREFAGLAIRADEVALLSERLLLAYAAAALTLFVAIGGLGHWALAGILRPLEKLAREAARRSPDNLAPFTAPGLRELEPMVARLNALLLHLDKALTRSRRQEEAARRFAAQASHELRTPLTALGGYLAVLTRKPQEGRAQAGAARELARLERLLSALLTLARLEGRSEVAVQPVPLAPLVGERFSELELCGHATPWAEPELLELALHTLLDNARRHGAPPYRLHAETLGDTTRLSLEDGGPGFGEPPPVVGEESSGLGLRIVQAVMDVHRGRLKLGRTPAGGAAVRLDFPEPGRG